MIVWIPLVEDFRAHVALGANFRIGADIQAVGGLDVRDSQAEVSYHALIVGPHQYVFRFYVTVSYGRFTLCAEYLCVQVH